MYCTIYQGVEIYGCEDFVYKTKQSLFILGKTETYQEVKPYLARIQQAKRSGMEPRRKKPTFEVGQATWQSELAWYASAIVHDACHSKLYCQNRKSFLFIHFTKASQWTGKEAEIICMKLQVKVLEEMNAGEHLIQYLCSHMANPKYHNFVYNGQNW